MMVSSIRDYMHSEWVEHTHRVMAAAASVRSSARSIESHARGDRLTGQAPVLAEYLDGVPENRRAVTDLVAPTADNPVQNRRARSLGTQVATRVARGRTR